VFGVAVKLQSVLLLVAICTIAPAKAESPFLAGDKVTVQHENDRSGGVIVLSARDSSRLIVRLDSILHGHSGLVYAVAEGGNYRLITGEQIGISR
jgi:hypothetical protein